jgi:hypothetical protein
MCSCRFVADVVSFLAMSPKNTVVLRCSDGFRRCCIMASALLLQLRELMPSSNLDELHISALNFYYAKRGNPQSNEEFLSPSQIRFVKFFSDCVNAGIVTPSVSVPYCCFYIMFAHFCAGFITAIYRHAHRQCFIRYAFSL